MKRPSDYNTKQRAAILNYIVSLEGAHITASRIVGHFEQTDVPIGRATVYRHLEKLTESGKLRRYTTDGVSGACYQHIDNRESCRAHLHLKCEACGELQHLDCDMLNDIQRHVRDRHNFEVDALKTVLYGKCGACVKNRGGRA